jgi:hypothetical protein
VLKVSKVTCIFLNLDGRVSWSEYGRDPGGPYISQKDDCV